MWYSRPFVALEIVKQCKGRETMFLCLNPNARDRIRYLNFSAIDYLFKALGIWTRDEVMKNQQPLNPYNFFSPRKNYSIYCSLATVEWSKSDIKAFSYHGVTRKQQQDLFKEKIDELLTDFDLLLDFDGDLSGTEHLEITKE